MVGRQAVRNATRYLARSGKGDHPPRRKADQLEDLEDIETALEDIARHIRHELNGGERTGSENPQPPKALPSYKPTDPDGGNRETPGSSIPSVLKVDRASFTVFWGEKECFLGSTKEFHVIERLTQSERRYVSYLNLSDDLWEGDASKNVVQKTISNLEVS